MSSAFDTINCQMVGNVLADAGCTDDELRLVRMLISSTKINAIMNSIPVTLAM